MNLIYSTEFKDPVASEVFRHLLTYIPPDMASKIQRYRRWQDTHASLFGKLLLTAALKDRNIRIDLRQLQYTNYGRPFLPDTPDFNISHSGHRVVCIVAGHGRAGIDLEEIRDLNMEDFKDQFTPEEWKTIQNAAEPLFAFYHYWTAKECLLKADGQGLNLPLANLVIEHDRTIPLNGRTWHLHTLPHFTKYACHAAVEDPMEQISLKEFSVDELTSVYNFI